MAELDHLKDDPNEAHNLIDEPAHPRASELRLQVEALMKATGPSAFKMPIGEGM